MSKILSKMAIKVQTMDEQGEKKTQDQIGAEVIIAIGENLHLAQDEVNAFMADLCGMTAEQFAELDIEQALAILKEFSKQPQVASFFKAAGRLTQ